jgi:hypothetical protein
MCRLSSVQLRARDPAAPRAARAWISDHLDRWELVDLREDVLILVSELTSNAIIHTHSSPLLSLAVADGHLEAGCTDAEPWSGSMSLLELSRREQRGIGRSIRPHGGRGLHIVDAVSDSWGQREGENGKHVWFRIAVREWPYRGACQCHSFDVQRVRLGSGGMVHHNPGRWDD